MFGEKKCVISFAYGGERWLDLEISDSSIGVVERQFLAGVAIRRLTVQHSGVDSVATDALAGEENVLQELDLSGNGLTSLPAAVSNLTTLWRLDVSHNRIRALPHGQIFFHLLKLTDLNLNYNR